MARRAATDPEHLAAEQAQPVNEAALRQVMPDAHLERFDDADLGCGWTITQPDGTAFPVREVPPSQFAEMMSPEGEESYAQSLVQAVGAKMRDCLTAPPSRSPTPPKTTSPSTTRNGRRFGAPFHRPARTLKARCSSATLRATPMPRCCARRRSTQRCARG